ncbi:hypothetical protein ABUL39_05195 [Rhodothermus marinus]|uniref:hypothetical protein n=1 Tax=Rhodothermus marinus TaxID=29549 RepID=UPI0037C53F22
MRRLIYVLFAALFMVTVSACGQRAAEQQTEQPAVEQEEAPAAVDTLQQDTSMAAPDTAAAAEQM